MIFIGKSTDSSPFWEYIVFVVKPLYQKGKRMVILGLKHIKDSNLLVDNPHMLIL